MTVEKRGNGSTTRGLLVGKPYIRKNVTGNRLPLVSGYIYGGGHFIKPVSLLIPFMAIAAITVGVITYRSKEIFYIPIIDWPLFYLLMVGSILLHELLKLISALAVGGFREVGIHLWGYVPIGSYIEPMDSEEMSECFRKALKMNISGISGSIMTAGLLLLFTVLLNDIRLSFTIIVCARVNMLLAILNALPIYETDGDFILRYLIVLRNKGLSKAGIIGYRVICTLSKIAFVAVLIVLWYNLIKVAVDSAWPAPYVLRMLERF